MINILALPGQGHARKQYSPVPDGPVSVVNDNFREQDRIPLSIYKLECVLNLLGVNTQFPAAGESKNDLRREGKCFFFYFGG